MNVNKSLFPVFFVLSLVSLASFADTIVQNYQVSITNNYYLKAVQKQLCPGATTNTDVYYYNPIPASEIMGNSSTFFNLKVTAAGTTGSYKTTASEEPGPCESSFGWRYYFITYKLYNLDGTQDSYERGCEFEYNLNGTTCEVYGRAITPDPEGTISCKATATYLTNACDIKFSINY